MSLTAYLFRLTASRNDRKRDEGLTTPEEILRYDNIPYGPDPWWHLMDIYRPRDAEGKIPVIIDVHGGGWVYGDKVLYSHYCMDLARRGFAVVNFNYRLAPRHRFPAGFQDMNDAVQFTLEHGEEFGLDLRNVFLVGDSAGAHMAALYACMCSNEEYAARFPFALPEDFMPRAVVLNCGIYDMGVALLQGKSARDLMHDLMGHRIRDEEVELLSPARHVTADFPPCYVMTATGDFLRTQPEYFLPVLEEQGIEHTYKLWGTEAEQLLHVFHLDLRKPVSARCNDEEAAFLKGYVR